LKIDSNRKAGGRFFEANIINVGGKPMKTYRIIFWVATILLSIFMLMAASMYVFNHQAIVETVDRLGYPSYIIYPLALAKVLGAAALLFSPWKTLTEWAYAGFFFLFLLAASAHITSGEGSPTAAITALILLVISYITNKKIKGA
jgi:hypothetical protein